MRLGLYIVLLCTFHGSDVALMQVVIFTFKLVDENIDGRYNGFILMSTFGTFG